MSAPWATSGGRRWWWPVAAARWRGAQPPAARASSDAEYSSRMRIEVRSPESEAWWRGVIWLRVSATFGDTPWRSSWRERAWWPPIVEPTRRVSEWEVV